MVTESRLENHKDKKFFEAFDAIGNMQKSKHIKGPLSEYDILDLQDKFLNNGFHYVNVSDLQFGRSLVFQFLKSLNYYHENAVLTISTPIVDNSLNTINNIYINDIYYELVQGSYLDNLQHRDLDEFFIDQFYYDFLWIEVSHELIDTSWFFEFFNRLVRFKVDQHIPVLVMSYSKDST